MAVSEVFNLDFKFGGNSEFLTRLEALMKRVDDRFDSVSDGIEEASDATKKMEKNVDDLNDSFREGLSSMSSFGEKLKDIAKYYISFSAAKMGAEKVWSFGMESMNAYSTQERAENQLKGVMKNRGTLDQFNEIKGYAAEIQGRSIYGDEALIKGAGELATYVKGTNSIKSMMDLLTDYAAGMTGGGEVSPEQMESLATGLGMAYDGNYMAMRRKGFDTSKLEALDAIVESGGRWGVKEKKKYGDVLDKDILEQIRKSGGVTEEMRVDALKEALGDWKNLSEAVNNLDSSAIIKFNNKLGDLREEIGKKVYPAFNKLVNTIDKHMPEIEEMFDSVGESFIVIADTIEKNLSQLVDFGKWLSETIPELVSFAGTITSSLSKVFSLTDAFKLLITYMAVDKVREFAMAIKMANESMCIGEGGGLIGSLKNFTKSAAGAQVALVGISWGLEQIMNLASAFSQYLDQKENEKKTKAEQDRYDGIVTQMISAKKAYNAGTITEEEYKRKYNFYNEQSKGSFKDSHFNIWKKTTAGAAKKAAKESKGNLYQQFNNTNIEQNVSLAADISKVGILLNQNIRMLIQSQLRQNREVSLSTGI